MTKAISTKLSDKEYSEFLKICDLLGYNSEDLLREITVDFLNGEKPEPRKKIDEYGQMLKAKDTTVYDSRGKLLLQERGDSSTTTTTITQEKEV